MAFSIFAAEDIVLPVGIQRIYQIPLDTTAVFADHESAVLYASKGSEGLSSAYRGQFLSIPDEGVYYINDNWELRPAGGIIGFAGENVDDLDTMSASELYFKMDYSDRDYTTFTNMSYYGTNYPTLLIPSRGERGFDGATNLMFGGYWDPTKAYENTNVLVSYEGNVYINVQPVPALDISITNDAYWKLLVSKGDKGDAGTIEVGEVQTGNPGSSASVTNVGTVNDAIFNFTIPRGDTGLQGVPGVDLAFDGTWVPNKEYRTNTLVRHLTNVWYTESATTGVPGESEDWKVFLMDGAVGPTGPTGNTGARGPKGDRGEDGGQYRFMVGWDKNFEYNKYDICVVSNDFYLCNQTTTNQAPWDPTYQQSGVWTKLISPEYRFYGLAPSRYYSDSDTYISNELVRYDGSTYVVTIPEVHGVNPTNESSFAIFAAKGDEGPTGPAIYPEIESITMLEPSAEPTVETRIDGTNAYYSLGIPRGQRGSSGTGNLIYYGQWEARTYDSNSLVRFGTNLWYTEFGATGQAAPPTNSSWDVYLSDGRPAHVIVDPKVDTLNPGQPAHVIVTDEGYNDIGLKFQIPKGATGSKGDKGDRGPAGAAGVGNLWFDGEWVSTKQYPTNVIVASSNDVYGDSLYVSIVTSSNICPAVSHNWKLYWQLLVSSGRNGDNGGLYRFIMGWDSETPYQPYDVCVISNNFYLCNKEDTINKKPWELVNQTDGTWTKMISPDYRFYGLSPSRYYSPSDRYVSNELVRWQGSTYVVTTESISGVEPNDASDSWAIFAAKGEKGDTGAAGKTGDVIYPHIENISMLEPEAVPTTSSRTVGTNVYYTFGIPRGYKGDPGADLVFYGDWDSNTIYNATSLVKHLTNTWYTLDYVPSHIEPGTPNSPWKIFTSDGAQGNPGGKGDTIIPFAYATSVSNEYSGLLVTNNLVGLTNYFYFKIPEGKQGEKGQPGADLVFYGTFNTNDSFEYPTNSLVRYGTNVWYSEVETTNTPGTSEDWKVFLMDGRPASVTVNTNVDKLNPDKKPYITTNTTPGNEQEIKLTFHIPQGYKGDTGTIQVGDVNTGDPGTDVIVTNTGSSTAAKFDFTIPRGYPGAGLTYVGDYESGHQYLSNSLVKMNTDLWYAKTNTTENPSTNSTDWSSFLTTTKFNILTNGEPLGPTQNPEIISTYDETNNVITMQFKIPRGVQGLTKAPYPGDVTNVPPIIEDGVEKLGEATVSLNPIQPDPNNIIFDFGIPAGLTGAQGQQGIPGTNATIIIGSVTNVEPISTNQLGPATVSVITNVADNSYTFNFGIPGGLKGQDGDKGEKGDNGAALVPKGNFDSNNIYYENEMIRYGSAQYYVIDDNSGQGVTNPPLTPGTSNWQLFVQDGSGTAVDATTLFKFDEIYPQKTWYKGPVLLDTNTLMVSVTNIATEDYNMLTVVGGVGGGAVKQWEIDMLGGMMPAEEMFAGAWDYDERGDLMPPLEEEAHHDPQAIVQVPITASRVVETASAHVMLSDYIIWMDGDTAGENQTLYLDNLSTNGQTVIVRQLGDTYETTIVRGNNTYSLYGDGSSITFDWLPMKNNWYWRNY